VTVFRIVVTDHPAPTIDVEAEVLAAIDGELIVAARGDEGELTELVSDADAILTCFRHVTPSVIRAGTRLRTIGRYGVGVDNIAVDVATERKVVVTNVPDYCVDEVAEHAIALLLTLARRTARYDRSVHDGEWRLDVGVPMHRLAGSTIGVIGYGRIGRAMVARALGLGMHVLVSDPTNPPEEIITAGATPTPLNELLAESDVVSLHAPLTPATRHLLNSERIARMKTGAYLINCARGAIVDLDALADAIASGALGGAGLDVFEPERLPIDHPLFGLENVVLTPHVAFYSEESIGDLQRRAAENVARVLGGQPPQHVVNPNAM
jgi:D-3-phosphoglycerate dehydrogenase